MHYTILRVAVERDVTVLRSALVVEVPEAAPAVDGWRELTTAAKPSSGVPAHVTILFPFVPARELDDRLLGDLHALFAGASAFAFVLRATRRFPGVLYLAPEPAEPFAGLTETVSAAYPAYPPYGGQFGAIVPHLTVAEGEDALLDRAEANVGRSLPIKATACEVLLLEEVEADLARWRAHARIPLGRA